MDTKDIYKLVGERIRELRKKKGETQEKLADIISSSQGNISKVENGVKCFTWEQLLKIADHYKVSITDIFDKVSNEINVKNLNKIVSAHYGKIFFDDEYVFPILQMDKEIFDYILKVARIVQNKDIQEDIKNHMLAIEKESISLHIKKEEFNDYINIVPLFPAEKTDDLNQQELIKLIENFMKTRM